MNYAATEQGSYVSPAIFGALVAATFSTVAQGAQLEVVEERRFVDLKIGNQPYVSTSLPVLDKYEIAQLDSPDADALIGEIAGWKSWGADWDGEGAIAPSVESCDAACRFVELIRDSALPESMLHSNGNAGLLWRGQALYADLEFLSQGKIAYFAKKNGDKHKGIIAFDKEALPPVLQTILAS